MKKIYSIQGVVQDYAWGGTQFIPQLLGIANDEQQACAELWMGAHPRGAARVSLSGNTSISLDQLIARHPVAMLGQRSVDAFGESLPYLFKVLDVKAMLSIQAHPTKAAAVAGFARENAAGIPLDAKHRNYKDDNHKPEVMVALTEFYLLHGFHQISQIESILNEVPEFQTLRTIFRKGNIKGLYQHIMELSQNDVNTLLSPLKKRLLPQLEQGHLSKDSPDYWAALAFQDYPDYCDRGVFSIYLFNLVKIEKGGAIYQAAGVPHAYLEGVNMELMANSDNVFRGGLTPKHIDVHELLEHLVFEPVTPQVMHGTQRSQAEKVFPTPAPDFELSEIKVQAKQGYEHIAKSGEIHIVMQGVVTCTTRDGKETIRLETGEQLFVAADTAYRIEGEGLLFKAAVPIP